MAESEKEEIHHYAVGVIWSGDAKGCGEVTAGGGTVKVPIGGATELGGCGKGANPEELLLAAVGACFVNTWAIFLKKLNLTYAEPALRVTGELGKDPAGGYKMLSAKIHARVPASLLSEKRAEVQKTLQLAEKYCITSKVARAAMPLEVTVEEV
ncbi:MAG: OsmC family protein [Thermoanaerobaculia bacterium]